MAYYNKKSLIIIQIICSFFDYFLFIKLIC